jgi:hypothetical protein
MNDTRIAGTYAYRHEAEFARETLRAAGIDSVLVGDDAGGAYAGMSFTRPFRLLVRTADLDAAAEVLGGGGEPPEDGDAA